MSPKCNNIKKHLEEYLNSLSPENRSSYLIHSSTLLSIVHGNGDDESILSAARKYDEQNNTRVFAEILKFRSLPSSCRTQ